MMCEDCGERPARYHLVTVVNGERVSSNLCQVCMARRHTNLAGILSNIMENRRGNEAEPLDAGMEDCVCEQCGMTYREFQKGGMLGCAGCYKAFKAPLSALLQRVHGNTQHAGRIPEGAHSGTSIRMNIDRLKQKLQKAIADEDYEQAAKLRDTIRALNVQLERKESVIHVHPQGKLSDEGEVQDDV